MKDLILLVRKGDVEELPLGPACPPLAWLSLKKERVTLEMVDVSKVK